MKIQKNKMVFGSIVTIVILFIVAYALILFMMEGEQNIDTLNQPMVPEIEEEQEQFSTKIDALKAIQEERQSNPPSLYSENLLDSLGVYDPAWEDKERELVIDSIYENIPVGATQEVYARSETLYHDDAPKAVKQVELVVEAGFQDLAVDHERFFLAGQRSFSSTSSLEEATGIAAEVNGTQKVQTNDRLELLLKEDVKIEGRRFEKNTAVYAFVKLQPNRVQLKITHIDQKPVKIRAYDVQDSNEGIYIKNTFRAKAGKEIITDATSDINIAGLPQVRGIMSIFKKDQRNLKVTILDQYQLILKPEQ